MGEMQPLSLGPMDSLRVQYNPHMKPRSPRKLSRKVDVPHEFRDYINEWMENFPLLADDGEPAFILMKQEGVIVTHPSNRRLIDEIIEKATEQSKRSLFHTTWGMPVMQPSSIINIGTLLA